VSRGGKREGAGRPHRTDEPTDGSRVTVRYSPAELRELDRRRGEESRAEYIRRVSVG
jgi:hypothetical protein